MSTMSIDRSRRRHHRTRTRARFQLEGLEERCLLSGISGYTEYPTPTASAGPTGIISGPDGNLWFLENSANKIGMINPTTHAVTEFPIPTANSNPRGIAAGPDGNIWFTERTASKIGMINLTTDAIREFATTNLNPYGITAGPDGNLWFCGLGTDGIGMINPSSFAMTEYPRPSGFYNSPLSITGGPDGNLWLTEVSASGIAQFNPTTHVSSVFQAPGTSSGSAVAINITAGPDGNVWFADAGGSAVGMINLTTDVITEYPVTTANSNPFAITSGPDGNVWFTETAASQLGVFNLTTHAINEYPVSGVNSIAGGPEGNLWFTDYGHNAIGAATLASSQLVVTQPPPASVTAGSPFGLTVQAEDSSGNPITSFNGTVTVALGQNPVGATLGGTLTVQASGGVATFSSLTLNKAASGYTLYASGGSLGWGVTNPITVTPAAATQLVITQQPPSTVKVNSGFGFQASIEDQYGNVVTTATNTVKVAFAHNPTGATLGGTLSVTASQGVATFSGLTINKTGSGYTLQVTSSSLSSAVTNGINVTKTGNTAMVATGGSRAPDPLLAPLVLDSPDLWDRLGFKKRSHAT
jgi:virginiamycin B lyase